MNSLSVKGRERSLRLKMLPSWQKKLIITTKLQNSKFCKATQHETMIYDLIIGNVAGVRSADDPDPGWQEACAVTTRSQAKKEGKHKPLKVSSSPKSAIVDRNELVRLQR